ncbi:MAG TPA: FAD-binding oxidoreductase [Actinomycetes bacterium]|nr:FAD-binding oxidoreductase [Actinomycetes bacterium]
MTIEAELIDAVGASHVLAEPSLTASYGTDWTGRWSTTPRFVVRPASTKQVSAVLRACSRYRIPVTAQGGNTGLVGGGVPSDNAGLVLSTTRLQRLDEVDADAAQVTVGAGVSIASLHRHATSSGLAYGVDLGSRDTATVGGTIATNAGGLRVVNWGDTRRQIVGLEVVLADGTIARQLTRLPKDSAGYDVNGLLVGSEGTLGVVTAARVRLVAPMSQSRVTALVGVRDVRDALALLRQDDLLAAEIVVGHSMELVCSAAGLPHPLQSTWPLYVLIETASEPSLEPDADAAVDRRLWAYRERQPEAVSTLGSVHSLDVAVPLDQLQVCLDALPELIAPHDCYVFGHLAEGNLHVQVVGAEVDDFTTDEKVLKFVVSLGGSISSEHGIGRAKAPYLRWARDEGTVQAMTGIKHSLDPEGLLNPGVLVA